MQVKKVRQNVTTDILLRKRLCVIDIQFCLELFGTKSIYCQFLSVNSWKQCFHLSFVIDSYKSTLKISQDTTNTQVQRTHIHASVRANVRAHTIVITPSDWTSPRDTHHDYSASESMNDLIQLNDYLYNTTSDYSIFYLWN